MLLIFKKILFKFTFNFSLFLLLVIGIQNSTTTKKLNMIFGESVRLPLSFIIGVSFIAGSLTESVLPLNKNDHQ